MTLIVSESGIRGVIGGKSGQGFTPDGVMKYICAFFECIKNNKPNQIINVIVGRDGRASGSIYLDLIVSTLRLLGVNVLNVDLTTTPSLKVAVINKNYDGAIMITASHNPIQWNALKLLNDKGEFFNKSQMDELVNISNNMSLDFAKFDKVGAYEFSNSSIDEHIDAIMDLNLINTQMIESMKFKVVVDGINSTGSIAIPKLLNRIGVKNVIKVNCQVDGNFAHNPEPLEKNLVQIKDILLKERADLAICVDPDVDRLVLINGDGSMFGEEYTLVACADYILSIKKGNVVSNLSSSRAIRDLAHNYGCEHYYAPVGEINVVEKMKEVKAIIGGEGNGGVIYPILHYGRDAVLGTAFILAHLSKQGINSKQLRDSYPKYFMSKMKLSLKPSFNIIDIMDTLKDKYKGVYKNTYDMDGFKMDFEDQWFHIRKSNTEAILRLYAEAKTQRQADDLVNEVIDFIK